MNAQLLARGLGWFGIGLGLAELLAPRKIKQATGIDYDRRLLQLLGLREIVSGIGILTQSRRTPWVWSRVAGDAVDMGVLGTAMFSNRSERRRAGIALAAVAGVTAVDVLNAVQLSRNGTNGHAHGESWTEDAENLRSHTRSGKASTGKLPLTHAITINRPVEEVYEFWRNFENLPRFMNHLKSVTITAPGRSHWVAKGPAGSQVEWDAEIIEEKPNELIAWRSLPGAEVENAGSVRFSRATGNRGTVVRVKLQYHPPGGALGSTVAKLFGEAPEKQIPVDLGRIKQLLETGEIARTEGQPAGRAKSTSRKFDDFVRI